MRKVNEMAVRAVDGSKTNMALKELTAVTGRLGRQAKAAAVSGSVCCRAKRSKVAGCSPRAVRRAEAG